MVSTSRGEMISSIVHSIYSAFVDDKYNGGHGGDGEQMQYLVGFGFHAFEEYAGHGCVEAVVWADHGVESRFQFSGKSISHISYSP